MERSDHLVFGPFLLETEKKRLWRGDKKIPLRPTSVAVLQMLVENAPDVVTKEQILKHVWAGTYVTRIVLRVCIREIRQALGDDAKVAQYVETVGRKGYRFIGQTEAGKSRSLDSGLGEEFEDIVGRTEDLSQLEEWFGQVRRGIRKIVFVTGEPGIGKSTVVELLLSRMRTDRRVKVGRGQCLEQYGEGEPYLPVLEAFGRLCRDPGGAPVAALLSRYAPTWMIQMPSLLSSAELASLQQRVSGANHQRMLREMADALEALTNESVVVLVLEDLHWSDYSTLELLAYLAQRQERIRLMVIGTYRPADLTTGHPLKKIKHEMQVRRQCEELPLALLSKEEVSTYVTKRVPENVASAELTSLIHRRTEGNALFMVNMVNVLQGQMVERDGRWELPVGIENLRVPESLRQVIEEKIERLSVEDRQILEAASAEGREFSCAAIAVATGRGPIEIEERCADLMRQSQFIQETDVGTWPDGTVTARYEFIHVLYHEVFYNRVTPGRRAQLHLRIGERLEQGYGDQTRDIAAELALHFEYGRDFQRAVHFLQQAADLATQRFAYPESVNHLTKALKLIKTFADTPERTRLELKSQISLGVALTATKGYAAPEVKQAYDRARELCQQIGQTAQIAPVLRGLAAFYYVRAELSTARELGEQLLLLAQTQSDESLLLEAHFTLGGSLFSLSEFTSALQHLEQGICLSDPQKYRGHAMLYGQDPGVTCLSRASHALWFLGYPDHALVRSQESLALAQELAHPHSLAYAWAFAALFYQLRGEPLMVQLQAERAFDLATEQGFPIWRSMGEILRGWSIGLQGRTQEGIALLQQGIATWRAIGAEVSLPYYFSLLAEVYGRNRDFQRGINVLDEALSLVSRTDDRWWEAELYRLKGELVLQVQGLEGKVPGKEEDHKAKDKRQKSTPLSSLLLTPSIQMEKEAEICFQEALSAARRQQAKSLELRAATSLARLWKQQHRETEARQLLSEMCSWFTEGFDTPTLREAKALLDKLGKAAPRGSSDVSSR